MVPNCAYIYQGRINARILATPLILYIYYLTSVSQDGLAWLFETIDLLNGIFLSLSTKRGSINGVQTHPPKLLRWDRSL